MSSNTLYSESDDGSGQNTVRAIDSKFMSRNDIHHQQHNYTHHQQLPSSSPSTRSMHSLKSESILRDAVAPALIKVKHHLSTRMKGILTHIYGMYSFRMAPGVTNRKQHWKHYDDHFNKLNENVLAQHSIFLKKCTVV